MPRPIARLAVRLLNRRNDALASAFGAGLHQDLYEATWDDKPLRQRGIKPEGSHRLSSRAGKQASRGWALRSTAEASWRHVLNQFDYDDKDPSVVQTPDPLIVHRG